MKDTKETVETSPVNEVVFEAIFTFTDNKQSAGKFGIEAHDLATEVEFRKVIAEILESLGEKRKLAKVSVCLDVSGSAAPVVMDMLTEKGADHWYPKCRGKLYY